MTKKRKLIVLFFLISYYSLSAQSPDGAIPMVEIFSTLEKQFASTFSYKDIDLRNHVAQPPKTSSLANAVEILDRETLFNFTILEDNTIAVSKKPDLISRCIVIFNSESDTTFDNVTVSTPYQLINTGSDGKASFETLTPSEKIRISSPGFSDIIRSVSSLKEAGCETITIAPKVEILSTVTLVNYLARGITKNSSGSISVDYDEFDIIPGLIEPDVLQTIQALPGIQSVNETVSYINIRGGTNDQNLILWDGIKMYQSGHFFGLISAFNPFLTDEVTIIKNGSSSRYGDGVSGIISMEGDKGVSSEFSGGWGVNLISTDAFAEVPIGQKASIQVAGRKSYNNLLETPTYTAYFDKAFQNTEVVTNSAAQSASNDDFTFYDSHLRLHYYPTQKDRIRVNFLILGNKLDFLENAVVDNEAQSRQSELRQDNLSAGLNYQRIWNDRLSSNFQLYATNYKLEATNFDILNAQRLLQTNEILESGVKLETNYAHSEQIVLMAGYQFNETGITNFEQINNPFFERTDKQVLRTNSVFTEINLRPFDLRTTLIAGIRLNHISKFNELLLEPRISINHRFLKYFSLDIAGELKSQTSSQIIDFQNDFLGVENRRWVLARENEIPIMRGQQLSTGINYSRSGWLINLEGYLKKVTGITTQSQGFQNQFENARTHGEYQVRGIDVLVNKRLKRINTWLSYSLAENNYTFDALQPMNFPNNIDVRHTFTYGITYAANRFKISGGLNYHSGKPITTLVSGNEIVEGELNFNAPNDDNINDYIRIDLSGTYSFKIGKNINAFAGVSCWNLFNTKNEVNNFYRIDNEGKPETISELALSFTPNATFRISF